MHLQKASASRFVRSTFALVVPLVAALATGCWDDPVRETLTVDLRQPRRVGLTVAIELDSPRELSDEPATRRMVEQTAGDLLEGRHGWNQRFAALDCESESGGWRKEAHELRRYELSAECSDPAAFAGLLADRSLVAELSFEPGGGELRIVPQGGTASRADRQRLERELDGFTRAVVAYVEAARVVARRADREPGRAKLLWEAVLVEADPDAVGGLVAGERKDAAALLDAMGVVLGAFQRSAKQSESLDALARRAEDPLPRRLEVLTAARARVEAAGFVAAAGGRLVVPPRGIEGALGALEGRWLAPDPALVLLRNVRSDSKQPPELAPFLAGSILRSEETIDAAALRQEIEAALAPPDELRLAWSYLE